MIAVQPAPETISTRARPTSIRARLAAWFDRNAETIAQAGIGLSGFCGASVVYPPATITGEPQ